MEEAPATREEAMASADAEHWLAAERKELGNFRKYKTFKFARLPNGRKAHKFKWVYTRKPPLQDGDPWGYKARLTIKGCSQIPGLEFGETFSPTVRLDTLRAVFAFAARMGARAVLRQVDVTAAYLSGDFEPHQAPIYMQVPDGLEGMLEGCDCVQLLRPLYGLKQAGRCWNHTLVGVLVGLGMVQQHSDPCLFIKHVKDGIIIIFVHVDDMLVLVSHRAAFEFILRGLHKHFDVKDLGSPRLLLGIEIQRDETTGQIKLFQDRYIKTILMRFGMSNCREVDNPCDHNVVLNTTDGNTLAADIKYREAVGALLWASICTRPDIAFAVNNVARYVSEPRTPHWSAILRVFRYLHSTSGLGLVYKGGQSNHPFEVYCDSDYAGDRPTRRSTTGYMVMMGGGPVAWRCMRQHCVTLSTAEAELYAACEAAKQTVWTRELLSGFGYVFDGPSVIFEDNQATIAITDNPTLHDRTKHVDIRYFYVREKVQEGLVKLVYVRSDENLADVLTKPLSTPKFIVVRRVFMA